MRLVPALTLYNLQLTEYYIWVCIVCKKCVSKEIIIFDYITKK